MCMCFIFCVVVLSPFCVHFPSISCKFQTASVAENLHTLLLLLFFCLLPLIFLCSHYSVSCKQNTFSQLGLTPTSFPSTLKKIQLFSGEDVEFFQTLLLCCNQNVLSHSLMMAFCHDSANSMLSFYLVISVAVIVVEPD